MEQERTHIVFTGPGSDPDMRYDTSIHDFVNEDGSLASPERVAAAFGMTPEEVVEDRKTK